MGRSGGRWKKRIGKGKSKDEEAEVQRSRSAEKQKCRDAEVQRCKETRREILRREKGVTK
jgi:hypothetical protein